MLKQLSFNESCDTLANMVTYFLCQWNCNVCQTYHYFYIYMVCALYGTAIFYFLVTKVQRPLAVTNGTICDAISVTYSHIFARFGFYL